MTKLKILIKKENRIKKQIAKNSFVWEYHFAGRDKQHYSDAS